MESIKHALNEAGKLVQQTAHSEADVFHTTETTTDHDGNKEKHGNVQKSDIKTSRAYEDKPQESDAKVLATSWPDLKGKTRQEAEELIKAKGFSNVKILKKGTSSTTEHDESRVILFVDDNDIVVEEPKVG
ncbi:unnamed protein product [Rotaria magnacalcarata]|uniref:Uncharacterized protein n=1 Tax=Rotaria magnacalcarata TaxID=392030 RepID=A0A816V5W6_9BILA|nr:unnamed protein product [Rotaria magnacalcarata]CAF1426552.1 unnamed protein product [Rotaria magnacalcarata]CAF1917081.1 unnamed protein product [Rotaria magnacalcarata]CAF2109779.1 unnamed protein product [Rotaria magnacalcarata]CAF2158721.1 unnamed protein product [Rotaria magnacalcarata]